MRYLVGHFLRFCACASNFLLKEKSCGLDLGYTASLVPSGGSGGRGEAHDLGGIPISVHSARRVGELGRMNRISLEKKWNGMEALRRNNKKVEDVARLQLCGE